MGYLTLLLLLFYRPPEDVLPSLFACIFVAEEAEIVKFCILLSHNYDWLIHVT